VGGLDGAICGKESLLRLCEKELTVRGEFCAAGGSAKECAANLTFKVGDLLADSGLRDVKLAPSLAEAAVIGYGAEVTEMSELHGFGSRGFLLRLIVSFFPMALPGNTGETLMRRKMPYSYSYPP